MNMYNLPIFMSVGEGIIDNLADELKKYFDHLDNKKILLLTTNGLHCIYQNKIDKVLDQIPNIQIVKVNESSFDYSVEIAKYICTNNISLILGFGGGKVLDTAKYASFVAKVTYIAIPTALSNDGLASPISVLYIREDKKKSFGSKIPDGIIVDTEVISRTPRQLLEAGIGDTVSNYTALFDWKLDCNHNCKHVNDFAYMLSEISFNSLLYNSEKSLDSRQFIYMMAQSLVLSGLAMQIAGNSRPCSGSEHLFSHAIDEKYNLNISHGLLVALGSLVSCILQERDKSIILNYLNEYGISINPNKLGISREVFIDAWLSAQETRKDRFTILNTMTLSTALFSDIYDLLLEVCK